MDTQQGVLLKPKEDLEQIGTIVFYFDAITEHSISLTSQITDNWMENNTVINDHIANQPLIVNLRGLKGELAYQTDYDIANKILQEAKQATSPTIYNKLSKLTNLYPPFDNYTQRAKNVLDYTVSSYKRYEGIVKQFFNTNNPQYFTAAKTLTDSKIKKMFDTLESMRNHKMPFEVETPWKTFKNMYIQSLTLRQGNQLYVSDIEVSLKQVYYADSLTTKADEKVLAEISAAQRARVENQGKIQGVNSSIIGDMIAPFRGDKYYTYKG